MFVYIVNLIFLLFLTFLSSFYLFFPFPFPSTYIFVGGEGIGIPTLFILLFSFIFIFFSEIRTQTPIRHWIFFFSSHIFFAFPSHRPLFFEWRRGKIKGEATIQPGHRRSFGRGLSTHSHLLSSHATPPEAMHTKGKRRPQTCSPNVVVQSPTIQNNQSVHPPRVPSVQDSYCQSYILRENTRTMPPLPSSLYGPTGVPGWSVGWGGKIKNFLFFLFRHLKRKYRWRRERGEGLRSKGSFPKANAMRVNPFSCVLSFNVFIVS